MYGLKLSKFLQDFTTRFYGGNLTTKNLTLEVKLDMKQ